MSLRSKWYPLHSQCTPPPDLSALLPGQDRQILDQVVDRWSSKGLSEVLQYVYSNPPYAGTEFGDRVPMENS